MSRKYDGDPIDASWNSDLKNIEQKDTVDVVDDEGDGNERVECWPECLPKKRFENEGKSGENKQLAVIRFLCLHPDATDKTVAENVDIYTASVSRIRSKASVFCTPDDVPFRIPEFPVLSSRGTAEPYLSEPESRFERNTLAEIHAYEASEWPEELPKDVFTKKHRLAIRLLNGGKSEKQVRKHLGGMSNTWLEQIKNEAGLFLDNSECEWLDKDYPTWKIDNLSERVVDEYKSRSKDTNNYNDTTLEILGRFEILGQEKETIAREMDVSMNQINGSMGAGIPKSEYIVPDEKTSETDQATLIDTKNAENTDSGNDTVTHPDLSKFDWPQPDKGIEHTEEVDDALVEYCKRIIRRRERWNTAGLLTKIRWIVFGDPKEPVQPMEGDQ